MAILACAFITALLITLLIVVSAPLHNRLSGDSDRSQPQKFHTRTVPRIGGVALFGGVTAACGPSDLLNSQAGQLMAGLLGASCVAFGAGLLEDITKRVTPKQRLLATVVAAALAGWWCDALILRSDIPGLDTLLLVAGVPMAVTAFAVAGVAHATNLIDGFNGLASLCMAMVLGAIAYVAYEAGDPAVAHLALAGLGAVLAFFIFNYPRGLLFLGDGGAYFLGFWVAETGILLAVRNPQEVSPLFPLALVIYPVFETVFTMYRRRVVQGKPMGLPDAAHLHSLVYRRLMRPGKARSDQQLKLRRNAMTAPHLWALNALPVLLAIVCFEDSTLLSLVIVGFAVVYLTIYRSIVRFRTPRVMVRQSRLPGESVFEDQVTVRSSL